ncbi:MAG: phosphatase PAP2-related protein [Minisyncoccia bacterium]
MEIGGVWQCWKALLARYRRAWEQRQFRISLPLSILFFAAAIAANTLAGVYATDVASNSVTDIILSNIPTFDVDGTLVWGVLVFVFIVLFLLLAYPERAPFTFIAIALFFLIRAVFVSLTHIGPYPDHAAIDSHSKLILLLWGGGDEFFSGHTGAPFMLALVFWRHKWWRYFFLASSIFFGVMVLLAHWHYSIDVASAFFITYAIYHIAITFFPRERALFEGDALPPTAQ